MGFLGASYIIEIQVRIQCRIPNAVILENTRQFNSTKAVKLKKQAWNIYATGGRAGYKLNKLIK